MSIVEQFRCEYKVLFQKQKMEQVYSKVRKAIGGCIKGKTISTCSAKRDSSLLGIVYTCSLIGCSEESIVASV